jgi:hypothetical protein
LSDPRRIADLTGAQFRALKVLAARPFNHIAGGDWRGAGDTKHSAAVVRALLATPYATRPRRGLQVFITEEGVSWLRRYLP